MKIKIYKKMMNTKTNTSKTNKKKKKFNLKKIFYLFKKNKTFTGQNHHYYLSFHLVLLFLYF